MGLKFKKTIIIFIIVLILILGVILIKNNYKNSKNGNNISNKSADEIENLILNIGSYEAKANITIKSNKNQNTYVVKQKYNKEGNLYRQEILEPSGIAGTLIQYDGKDLTIKNTNLNVKKIYENYSYIESNILSLASFIEDYKQSESKEIKEENGIVTLQVKLSNNNKYTMEKTLYINKNENKIEKMEIKDTTQNVRIYILYNEIEFNNIPKEEVLAFSKTITDNNI